MGGGACGLVSRPTKWRVSRMGEASLVGDDHAARASAAGQWETCAAETLQWLTGRPNQF
jgi:hypothetical protein